MAQSSEHVEQWGVLLLSGARICLSTVDYPPRTGGVAVSSSRLADNLARAGYVVHVATAVEDPDPKSDYQTTVEDGIHVHRVQIAQRFSRDGVFASRQMMYRLDEEIRFDLFHGYFLSAAYPCVLAAARGGRPRPVIASACGTDVAQLLDQPLSRGLLLPALHKATWITSVNQMYLDRIAEEIAVAGRSSVIRNAVARRSDDRSWRLTPENRGIVGTVGEFRKVKDVPLLVRAYAAVPPRVRRGLLLAGYFSDPEEQQWSETLIDEFGLGAEVERTGRFPHAAVVDHLARMHVYVQSSWDEGLPNAVLEAAALGVPIIATAVGGLREVLTDDDTALLVPHGDPGRMANAIGRVLADDGLAAALSAGARRLVETLSPEREQGEWLGLYARLLANPE